MNTIKANAISLEKELAWFNGVLEARLSFFFEQDSAFDMLLDRIPWSFSTIRHAWMDRVVHVEWR